MKNLLPYIQMGLAVLLVVGVLMQQRGAGLSSAFGGSGMEYSTKRGAEKFIFWATVVFSILFIGVSITRIALA